MTYSIFTAVCIAFSKKKKKKRGGIDMKITGVVHKNS